MYNKEHINAVICMAFHQTSDKDYKQDKDVEEILKIFMEDKMNKKNESQFSYVVNKEKAIVIAIMKNTEKDAIDFIKGNSKNIIGFSSFDEDNIPKKMLLKEKYIGKAKCSYRDEFDIETGKKIARTKALHKHYKDFYKVVAEWKKDVEIKLKNMELKALDKYMSSVRNERKVLEDTVKNKLLEDLF